MNKKSSPESSPVPGFQEETRPGRVLESEKIQRVTLISFEGICVHADGNDAFLGQCPKSGIHYTTRQQLMIG